MTNPPLIIDVHSVLNQQATTEPISSSGPSPLNLGGNMLAIREGTPIHLDGTATNLGEAILIDAQVGGTATGTCARCLRELSVQISRHITQVFGTRAGFITTTGDGAHTSDGVGEEEDAEELPPLVEDEHVDLTQTVVDEFGLNAPFNPVCEDYGQECAEEIPAPDGVAVEKDGSETPAVEKEDQIDPRWAGLQKFLED